MLITFKCGLVHVDGLSFLIFIASFVFSDCHLVSVAALPPPDTWYVIEVGVNGGELQ